jgi:hypothetical protein
MECQKKACERYNTNIRELYYDTSLIFSNEPPPNEHEEAYPDDPVLEKVASTVFCELASLAETKPRENYSVERDGRSTNCFRFSKKNQSRTCFNTSINHPPHENTFTVIVSKWTGVLLAKCDSCAGSNWKPIGSLPYDLVLDLSRWVSVVRKVTVEWQV